MHEVLDAPLAHPAELYVSRLQEEALVAGAFQRCPADVRARLQRVSGGAVGETGPGRGHVVLALERPAALVPCDAARLVNRYVRPLLSALTRLGVKASYYGRDWVSATKRPVAWVGFAHDAGSGRAAMEAFVAVSTPFASGPRRARASFQGKEPATLEDVSGRAVDVDAVVDAVAHAYTEAYGCVRKEPSSMMFARAAVDGPWAATAEEAIGEIGAGPDSAGILRVGGDFLASRDAVARLEAGLAALAQAELDAAGIDACVRSAFSAPDVALEGVRALSSITDVITRALASR